MFFETLKANLLILVFLAIMVAIGYWAVKSLQVSPEEFDAEVTDVRPVIVNEPTGYNPNGEPSPVTETPTESSKPEEVEKPTTPSISESSGLYDELIADLQKLITDNVLMKKGSRGTRVGTVQEFLNIYNGTDSKIDNDYGGTTENQIKAFQKAEGIPSDGQAGPGTYTKMVDWLKKQN